MVQSARAKFVFWALFVTFSTCVMAEDMDAVNKEETSDWLNLNRRAVLVEKEGFTDAEKAAIVEQHNVLRSRQGASNMQRVEWDSELEKFAQAWSNKCVADHSGYESVSSISVYDSIGENVGTSKVLMHNTSRFVAVWYNEVNSGDCGSLDNPCLQYTQVVWADTVAVGCGVKSCSDVVNTSIRNTYMVTCNYGPTGNYEGELPFKKGPACSECPETRPHCVDGLCSLKPAG